ncbi:hypothetical protein D6T63_07760 [Arthrobacter cheniae]|uniref:Uncharacterized protein n=1 Tax=Arthrobacter cheniae TaxID=1258888 RepID=A0A3A5M3N0_9MICC|nr:hypothetical protein D6T63_07760 [Arthrobacter cheniae]
MTVDSAILLQTLASSKARLGLEAVRVSLAADVLSLLPSTAAHSGDGKHSAPALGEAQQTLLCAAVADLQRADEYLHLIRTSP